QSRFSGVVVQVSASEYDPVKFA
ncbi:MAG: hypothetical protein FD138_4239, partial [Planctomycetota bacterium]